jgi:hypothetical protein
MQPCFPLEQQFQRQLLQKAFKYPGCVNQWQEGLPVRLSCLLTKMLLQLRVQLSTTHFPFLALFLFLPGRKRLLAIVRWPQRRFTIRHECLRRELWSWQSVGTAGTICLVRRTAPLKPLMVKLEVCSMSTCRPNVRRSCCRGLWTVCECRWLYKHECPLSTPPKWW